MEVSDVRLFLETTFLQHAIESKYELISLRINTIVNMVKKARQDRSGTFKHLVGLSTENK